MTAAITKMANALEPEARSFAIPADLAPTEDQRFFLTNRVSEINQSLAPAQPSDLLGELWAMFRTMAMRSGGEEEMGAAIKVYVADLEGLPLWAISEACKAFRRGEAGNGTFVPTPGELRKRAKAVIDPHIDERAKLQRILDARVLPKITDHSETRKAATLAHVKETVAILTRATERSRMSRGAENRPRPLTVEEAQGWLEREAMNPAPTPQLSPTLRASMGLPDPIDTSDERDDYDYDYDYDSRQRD